MLGVGPLLGRGFIEEDDRPGGRNDVVILTEELWRSRFGGNPSIVNTTIILDDVSRTVVGILPRGAWLFREDQFFVPLVLTPGTPRAARVSALGRGVRPAQAGDDDRARRRGVERASSGSC